MQQWGVLVWNMGLMSRPRGPGKAKRNMGLLWELAPKHNIRVGLLNEASVYHLRTANAEAVGHGRPEPFVFSKGGIRGRDFWTDERGVPKLKNRKRWSSAVMSPLGSQPLGEDDVRARAPSRRNPIVDIPFTNSRPGTWIATKVSTERRCALARAIPDPGRLPVCVRGARQPPR